MISILFWTTPKGDLPQYSYIFRKTEPLGTNIKNVECYRLGTMLYLYIKKGKEYTKTAEFQQNIGGTAVCMKRPIIATKGCYQLMSNDT